MTETVKESHGDDAVALAGLLPSAAPRTMRPEPEWVRYAIGWHVFPLGFLGTPTLCPEGDPADPHSPAGALAAEHRLRRLIPWLDHLVSLGCNVLQLGPVFASMSHGYDTVDHLRVDPRLGDDSDLLAVIEAAHTKGVKVLLDGVFNHVGKAHPAFARLAQEGPSSPTVGMFHLSWPGGPEAWQPGTPPEYQRFEGQDWLPVLKHTSPAVVDLVASAMAGWCERGVDGWRLDAAYAVEPTFWTHVLPGLRERFPEVYVYGEVIHGDYVGLVSASGMDTVTQYELWQAIWHSLADLNLYELDWTLHRGNELLNAGLVPWTFVGNHDTSRIASLVGDRRHLPHAFALLLLSPGTPCLYYGDEEGMEAVKEERLGGDDAIRPAFPDSPASLPESGVPVRRLVQQLVALRRRLPWLHDALVCREHLDNRQMVLALSPRIAGDAAAPASEANGETAGVRLALSLEDHEVWLPTGGFHQVLAATHDALAPRPEGEGVVLPPHGWAVLSH
ncbi:alpha-amylase family glycosyl hydrolase [Actinomyces trachealis]|uniref:alpha-amylase family glycosyl hydrolase n=1 Tax=Actinomyces trachealis TaxID=2763540 RepID=UPI001FD2FF40|nr:alpha-amylase family glycosyl hydrolase [Actinomyces trachealis]